MLTEIINLNKTSRELDRRWFSDPSIDLYVWYNHNKEIVEFQISYDKQTNEKILSWDSESGFTNHNVDSGNVEPNKMKRSPIMTQGEQQNITYIKNIFITSAQKLEHDLYQFILSRLDDAI
ncbi:MAG: hypothetical protein ACI9XC_001529 [Gammaproteobacteria bacterium]|jgi:hypothetical protein